MPKSHTMHQRMAMTTNAAQKTWKAKPYMSRFSAVSLGSKGLAQMVSKDPCSSNIQECQEGLESGGKGRLKTWTRLSKAHEVEEE